MRWRNFEETCFKFLMISATLIITGALLLILLSIVIKGLPVLTIDMIIKTPKGGYYIGNEGGILNAIIGSLLLGIGSTILAMFISIPIALYINVYSKKDSKFAFIIRFVLDALWGIPSIVYGAFGFSLMLFFNIPASLLAGMITLALLITPIMSRGMDEVLKMVPNELQLASYSLGATRAETACKVVFRQAFPGMLTAILIAFGRGIGDAASVLFTAGFTDYIPTSIFEPVATLPLAIFFQLGTPFPEVQNRGYAAAFILTLILILISLTCRFISTKFNKHSVK